MCICRWFDSGFFCWNWKGKEVDVLYFKMYLKKNCWFCLKFIRLENEKIFLVLDMYVGFEG